MIAHDSEKRSPFFGRHGAFGAPKDVSLLVNEKHGNLLFAGDVEAVPEAVLVHI